MNDSPFGNSGSAARRAFILACALMSALTVACAGKNKGFSLAHRKEKSLNDCLELAKKKKGESAIQCFESYKSRHFGQKGAAEADLAIADTYFKQKDYLVAAEAYNLFLESYPEHARAPYAYYKSGVSYLKTAPKTVDRDQTYLEYAAKQLGIVVNGYPGSSYAGEAKSYYEDVTGRMAKKDYYVGRFYYKTKEYLASIPRFQTVITDYPGSSLEDKSFYYLVSALKKTDQSDVARKYFEVYKEHYPDRMESIKKMARLF
jgi:outer membrane protein assembly factor BamD